MDPKVETTINELTRAKDQMVRALKNTPDERLHWSPAPTARTPLALVGHSAVALGHIKNMLDGTPCWAGTTAEADAIFMEEEKSFKTREEALDLLNKNFQAYVDLLNGLTPEDMDKLVTLPFGLGQAPLHATMGAGIWHTQSHTAQLEYIQTAYGDRAW